MEDGLWLPFCSPLDACVVCLPVCQEISQKQKEFCTMYEVRNVFSLGGPKKSGDSGGALTFLLKPQVPKTKMKQ